MREHFYIQQLDVRISDVEWVEDDEGAKIEFNIHDIENVSDEKVELVKEWIYNALMAAVDETLDDE